MSPVIRSEFALALNQVANERGVEVEVILEGIKAAILAAYRKDYGEEDAEKLSVELDSKTGGAKIFKGKKDITPHGFGRIAAQTAKQVILQRIREAEKKAILDEYEEKIGSVVSGMIVRFEGKNIIVEIGRAEGLMPPEEQIPIEHYHINQKLPFYLLEIREEQARKMIIVSRTHPNFVIGLFRREVPEVANNAVEIKGIAREPGIRTKIAVFSRQGRVDPVGSCVGQKGVRVQAVISELGGREKIDVIQWTDDPTQFISASLAPAKDVEIELNKKKDEASVTVPEDQLSLAIGREGQNVRLASQLTGYRIDIKAKKGKKTSSKAEPSSKTPKKEKNLPVGRQDLQGKKSKKKK